LRPAGISAWRQNLAAARANLGPALVLQASALALVLAYYYHPPTHGILDLLATFKARWGLLYSAAATALCGGAIPFLYMRLNPRTRSATPRSHAPFYLAFWAYKGMEVDLFYRFQGWLFGNQASAPVIAKKVFLDEFGYTVFWALPTAILFFYWKDTGFDSARMRTLDVLGFWKANLPKVLIGAWCVWLPAVTVIYSLPASLQIPLFNIVLCFYALLFATVNAGNTGAARVPAAS
jgi:hypothetical protein